MPRKAFASDQYEHTFVRYFLVTKSKIEISVVFLFGQFDKVFGLSILRQVNTQIGTFVGLKILKNQWIVSAFLLELGHTRGVIAAYEGTLLIKCLGSEIGIGGHIASPSWRYCD